MELHRAQQISSDLVAALSPHCDKIYIAGSVRRLKPDVKDIELVVQPKMVLLKTDLFSGADGARMARSSDFVGLVAGLGSIEKGHPASGRYVQIGLPQGINLDLFIPEPHDFYRQFAIRTGSADFTQKMLATGWVKNGWRGTDNGLRRSNECTNKAGKWVCNALNPILPPVWKSEQEFFDWLGLEWVEPQNRIYP